MTNAFDMPSAERFGQMMPEDNAGEGSPQELQAEAERLLPYLLPLILKALGADVQAGPGPSPYGGPPPSGALGSPEF